MLEAADLSHHSRQLLLHLNAQRTKGFLCDVILVVQNALFRAHKNVLAASSAYLKALVVHDNLINLDQEMVSPAVFRAVLDFIYTGRLGPEGGGGGGGGGEEGSPEGGSGGGASSSSSSSEPSLGAVLAAASYLQIPDLVALCKKRLKRSGKYCPLRGGFSPFGKLARGLRAATPVIQSCYAAPPPPPPPHPPPPSSSSRPPGEPGPPLGDTDCGELYAAAAASHQGALLHPPGLCPPERLCSPLCGLDLSKKSPNGLSPQLLPPPRPPSEGRLRESAPSLPPTPESPALLGSHLAFGEATPFHGLSYRPAAPLLPPLPRGRRRRRSSSSPPGPEPLGGRAQLPPEFLYHWMKPEPPAGDYEEEEGEEEGEEEEEEEEGSGGGDSRGRRREKGLDGELDPKADEETGCCSSGGGSPSPDGGGGDGGGTGGGRSNSLERYLGYDPESFGGDNLYVCIPCGKGFPSSEQLNAHVEAHNEEDELYRKHEAAAGEGGGGGGGGAGLLGPPRGGSSPFGVAERALPAVGPMALLAGPPPLLPPPPLPPPPPPSSSSGDLLRPYRCASCDKAYKDPATLRQHEKTHWLTRPYPSPSGGP
ncbi:hypothetical protein JRQ81_008266 [Phrynocephalus forsythii]|uniref:Hypermethylated in cancer 1 protein n=1 Tax=Phrynocephalus forsythii TaxID=171643 RepID=A0A9Q0XBJ7_9SAUR|nr:hypothetical protein JRQ81_008266 [Phrynocephalus forsythii]